LNPREVEGLPAAYSSPVLRVFEWVTFTVLAACR
jgi:hypothetical protein